MHVGIVCDSSSAHRCRQDLHHYIICDTYIIHTSINKRRTTFYFIKCYSTCFTLYVHIIDYLSRLQTLKKNNVRIVNSYLIWRLKEETSKSKLYRCFNNTFRLILNIVT